MDDVILARSLHVLAVVIWIGGMSMATTIALPAVRRGDLRPHRMEAFHAIEQGFIQQARLAHVVTGLSGLYMTWRLDLWERFIPSGFWWMQAMLGVWIVFAVLLFVGEPFVLRRHFGRWAAAQPRRAFTGLIWAHWVLLALALVTIFGAVSGSHGWTMP